MSNEYLSTNSLPTLDLNWCVAYICGSPTVKIKLFCCILLPRYSITQYFHEGQAHTHYVDL